MGRKVNIVCFKKYIAIVVTLITIIGCTFSSGKLVLKTIEVKPNKTDSSFLLAMYLRTHVIYFKTEDRREINECFLDFVTVAQLFVGKYGREAYIEIGEKYFTLVEKIFSKIVEARIEKDKEKLNLALAYYQKYIVTSRPLQYLFRNKVITKESAQIDIEKLHEAFMREWMKYLEIKVGLET